MRKPSRFFILVFFSFTPLLCFSQNAITTGFHLPDNGQSGLYWCGFEIIPQFSSLNKELWLKMQITLSTASNIKGSYEYRYRYNGEIYTDQMIGGDVFQPINMSQVIFDITVQGPGVNVTTTYDKLLGALPIKDTFGPAMIPPTAKPSDYYVTIRGIREITFTGTQAITKKIQALHAQKKNEKEYAEIINQADENLNANKLKEAQDLYKKAQALKPDETYPQAQLTKIDESLKKDVQKKESEKEALAQKPAAEKKVSESSQDDDFWNDQPTRERANEPQKQPDIDYTAETEKKLDESNKTYWAEKERSDRMIEQRSASLTQSFYAAQAIKEGKQNLSNLTRLDGNYNSVQELENDFNQKYLAIRSEVENLNQVRNDGFQSVSDMTFSGSGENGQAAGRILSGMASNINDARAEKERKQAQRALEEAREKKIEEMEAREKVLKAEMRKNLLSQFPDGGVPLSSHKIKSTQLFYFAYIVDENTLDETDTEPFITITNVFQINQYADGTWPFKVMLKNELQKLGTGTVTLMGYYTTEQLAKEMQNAFVNLSKKCEFDPFILDYKPKKSSATNVPPSEDFWGNDQKKVSPGDNKPAKAKDDFWDN